MHYALLILLLSSPRSKISAWFAMVDKVFFTAVARHCRITTKVFWDNHSISLVTYRSLNSLKREGVQSLALQQHRRQLAIAYYREHIT